MRYGLKTTTFGGGWLAAAVVLWAAPPAAGQDMPAARDLVDRHVEAAHAEVLIERGAIRSVSEFTMASLGTTGEIEVTGAAPNRMAMRMTLPGLGDIRSGFDGSTGWSVNPMEGPRVMSGDELAQIRDEADFGANIRSPELIDSMETIEKTEMGGNECWKVRLVWKSGRETYDCYGVDSGYLVGTQLTTQTAMGSVESTITFEDYTDFDGVMLPRISRQKAFGQEMVITLKSVEFGKVDSSAFALPDEIRALVGK